MRLSFNLLRLGQASLPGSAAENRLLAACGDRVAQLNLEQLLAWPEKQLEEQIVLVAGKTSVEELLHCVRTLASVDAVPIVVVDALEISGEAGPALAKLAEERIQFCVSAQVKGLVNCRRPMLYVYPKADCTVTILVVVDAGRPDARVLTIVREHAPFRDMLSLPGGFLNPHLETLAQCGAREGHEETGVSVAAGEMISVDVRSSTQRDERGHVVDHGYMWLVPDALKARVLASVKAGDDAKAGSASFQPVVELLNGKMAFDHYDFLLAAVRTGRVLPPAGRLLRFLRFLERRLVALALRLERKDAIFGLFHRS